jgi:hypothetical protein
MNARLRKRHPVTRLQEARRVGSTALCAVALLCVPRAVWADATSTPLTSPAPVPTFDAIACGHAIADFRTAFRAWNDAFNAYVATTEKTTLAQPPVAPPGSAWRAVAADANTEVKAIVAIINTNEPGLAGAQSEIDASHAVQTTAAAADVVRYVHGLDLYSLALSKSRRAYLAALAAGRVPGALDPAAAGSVQAAKDALERSEDTLRKLPPCDS